MDTSIEKEKIIVSVILPVRNEEKYIKKCIESLLCQDYPQNSTEIIFVDGISEDNTVKIIDTYIAKHKKLIKVLKNPNKTVPYAMNMGIRAAIGNYIVRMDAHSDYAQDYISKCVYYLTHMEIDNVGGFAKTKCSSGYIGEAIALMLSSRFGVGDSKFRTNSCDGYVDTVPFGAFRKSVFDKIGYYDERLTRNQDNEMNYRIRKNGGKIYITKDINLTYYCRDSLNQISKMAYQNGMWNIVTYYLCPGSLSMRHFIPFIFVFSLITLIAASLMFGNNTYIWLLFAELIAYVTLDLAFSLKIAIGSRLRYFPILAVLFPLFHISYGLGSINGFKKLTSLRRDEKNVSI